MDKPIIVPFEHCEAAAPNRCIDNVEIMVAKYGGDVVLGWRVMHDTRYYDVYYHHALWRQPCGKLVDITPAYHMDGYILMTDSEFVEDETATFEVGPHGRICRPAECVPIVDHDTIKRVCDALNKSERHYILMEFEKGDYWTDKANDHLRRHSKRTGDERIFIPYLPRYVRYGDEAAATADCKEVAA